jgi:hypothetical protein
MTTLEYLLPGTPEYRNGQVEALMTVAARIRAIDSEEEDARLQDPEQRTREIDMPSARELYTDADFMKALADSVALLSHASELTTLSARIALEKDTTSRDPAAGGILAWAAEGLSLDGGQIRGYGDSLMKAAQTLLGGMRIAHLDYE